MVQHATAQFDDCSRQGNEMFHRGFYRPANQDFSCLEVLQIVRILYYPHQADGCSRGRRPSYQLTWFFLQCICQTFAL
jgi:hypothetical protein